MKFLNCKLCGFNQIKSEKAYSVVEKIQWCEEFQRKLWEEDFGLEIKIKVRRILIRRDEKIIIMNLNQYFPVQNDTPRNRYV